jgi:3-oxoacyl-[acyl-carrier protein] reductase
MDKRSSAKVGVDPYEALRAEIARRHPEFPDRLKVIAEFALEHPTEMALGTVAEIASRARVQPSAVVRFANALGFGGFTEVQQVFRSRLVASVAPTYKERIAGLRRDGRFRDTSTPHSVLVRFASEGLVSLESLQQGIREKDLARAISLIGGAETIFVLGLGGSFPVASHLTYVLRKLGRRVALLDGLGSALEEQAVAATPRDVLVAISFKSYNRDTARIFDHRQPDQPDCRRRQGGVRDPRHAGSRAAHDGGADVPCAKHRRRPHASAGLGGEAGPVKGRRMSKRLLEGKVALVTGAGRGLGRAFAEHLASLGCNIAVHGMREQGPSEYGGTHTLSDVAREIAETHRVGTVKVLGDLTRPEEVDRVVREASARLGPIDFVVHNAGGDIAAQGGKPDPNDVVHIKAEDVRAVIDRNLLSTIFVCQRVARDMMQLRSGRIITIGSVAAFKGRTNASIYATAKAGAMHFTRCLADQMRPYDVTVNCIAPGDTRTERFLATRMVDPVRMAEGGTLDRIATVDEVARVVEFFAGPMGAFVSGQVIRVDGGGQAWPA